MHFDISIRLLVLCSKCLNWHGSQLGATVGSSWGISSIFGGSDHRTSVKENSTSKPFSDPIQSMEHSFSMIHLREVGLQSIYLIYTPYLFSLLVVYLITLKLICGYIYLILFLVATKCLEAHRNPHRSGDHRNNCDKTVAEIILWHC